MRSYFKQFMCSIHFDTDTTTSGTTGCAPDLSDCIAECEAIIYRKPLRLMPGANRLVRHLNRQGIQMAIATANTSRHVEFIRLLFEPFFNAGHYFAHIVSGSDDPEVTANKPDPQIYHTCARRFTR